MRTLELTLTTKCCIEIIELLIRKHRWSMLRISRTIAKPKEYVRRIKSGNQSFQLSDVEALAMACDLPAYRLIFDSLSRKKLGPKMRGLYDLGKKVIEAHEEVRRLLHPKPRKRRTKIKAA